MFTIVFLNFKSFLCYCYNQEVPVMDDLDQRIIQLLAQNARMPVKEIAQSVSLTSPAVSSRIHKLEQDGIISGYTVKINPPDSQTRINALISISIPPAERTDFMETLKNTPQVTQCFHVTGSYSYIVKTSCPDMDSLERLITSFQKIGQTSTQIILSTPVDRKLCY